MIQREVNWLRVQKDSARHGCGIWGTSGTKPRLPHLRSGGDRRPRATPWRLELMEGKHVAYMRHKVGRGGHCFEYDCDFRPYCVGNRMVAVSLTLQPLWVSWFFTDREQNPTSIHSSSKR